MDHGSTATDQVVGHGDEEEGRFVTQSANSPRTHRALRVAASSAAPVAWGVIAGWWTPRGPLTTVEVLVAMAVGLLVGLSCGVVSRSRWSMLLAPLAFAVVFELVRVGAVGPTVDGPRFSTYGVFALVVGRGFHGLVALTPMVLGAAAGAGISRQRDAAATTAPTIATTPATAGLGVRRVVAAVGAFGLIVLAALIARPATTDPTLAEDGEPVPGSVAELTTVRHDDHDLGLMVRGVDRDAPVVLFLAGGPGGSERGAMRNHLAALEEDFVVATWDQRGTGTSYDELDPTSTLTLDSYVADTIVVTDHLRERFDQDRIYLLGQSWGTTLGVLAVQQAPDRYRAFIGTGQMVSQLETDRIFHADTLAWAEETGDDALADRLREIGPPPYDDMLDYETALSYEHEVYPYDHSPNAEGEGGFSENFLVPEYTLTDQVHLLGAFMDTFAVLYPQLQDVDFRRTATRLEVPVFVVQGAHEADGRAEPFAEWYERLDAPTKDLVVLDTSGHRPLFEQPDEFVEYLNEVVVPRTADEPDA